MAQTKSLDSHIEMTRVEVAGRSESPAFHHSVANLMSRGRRWVPLAVFAASILITLTFWRLLPNSYRLNEQSDYFAAYEPLARNILAGNGLSFEGQFPTTSYPPGYGILLAGVFGICQRLGLPEETGLSALDLICMALVSVFVFLITQMGWGIKPAILSSLIWMTYPFALWLTKQPNSELPFMVVLYGGFGIFWAALIRRMPARVYFLCGFVFGVAMLIRPIAIGIGLVLSGVLWFSRRELARRVRCLMITMLLLGNLLAILPWESWVYLKTGQVILLSTNGVKSMRDGLTFAVEPKGYRVQSKLPPDVLRVMEDIKAHENELTTFVNIAGFVSREFRTHPLPMAKLFLFKLARSWYATDSQRNEVPILLIQLIYFAVVVWASWKLWTLGGIHRTFLTGNLAVVAYFWGMTLLTLSILRYMVPAVGLTFVLIAVAMNRGRIPNKTAG
jgi:4-amino-4-deoxy-L-arabinose transferase-like glycosyltransferase